VKKFRVNYWYDGKGYVDIEAMTKADALDKYYQGGWADKEVDLGGNFELKNVEVVSDEVNNQTTGREQGVKEKK